MFACQCVHLPKYAQFIFAFQTNAYPLYRCFCNVSIYQKGLLFLICTHYLLGEMSCKEVILDL